MRNFIAAAALALVACGSEPVPPPSEPTAEPGSSPAMPGAVPPAESATKDPAPAASTADNPRLAVEGGALRLFNPVNGSARPIPFGTPRERVLAVLAFRGPPGTGRNADCGVDYANWPDGLGLHFQGGKFVGWTLDGRAAGALGTAGSIGPGSTRRALDDTHVARHFTSTLGEEFVVGDFAGLLDGKGPDAKITNMWSGVSCAAR